MIKQIMRLLPNELTVDPSRYPAGAHMSLGPISKTLVPQLLDLRLHQMNIELRLHEHCSIQNGSRAQTPAWSTIVAHARAVFQWYVKQMVLPTLTNSEQIDPSVIQDYVMLIKWTYQLVTLQSVNKDDVLLSSRGSHGISAGDVIEVYHPDDAHHALFLVSTLRDDVLTRDVISIEHTLAVTLKLQQHKSVCVRNFDSITLDMVEFYFREQYLNRCDLYRFTQELLGSVLQVNKKVTLDDMRVQVGELWRKGEKYSCGFVGPATRAVFRSLTALVQVFIQLSEEMWSFDEHGDLYFEKALKFLSKLSLRLWSDNGCSHNVTVILFTRVYLEGLPAVIQNRMHCNSSGQFFEDFYHVLVQNERFQSDEWKRVLTQLKLEFKVFQQGLLSHLWNRYPSLKKNNNNNNLSFRITSAAEGNFLEAISMAMNLYSSYNVDRNCDRTGNMPLVITPGTGCFRVDSRLLKLTDQRVLHFGVGIDLICLGPQPLHSVPLFEVVDADRAKYVTPYWIDCSFFRSTHEMRCMGLGHPINRIQIFPSFETHSEKFNDITSTVSSTLIGEKLLENDSVPSSPRDVTPIYQIIYPHPPEVPLLCELSAPQVDLSSTSDELPHPSYRPQGTNHSPITTTTPLSYLPNPTVSALHTTALDSRMNRDLSAGSHCSDSNTGSPDALHSDADGSTPPPPQQSIPTEIGVSASKLIPQPSRSLRANLGRSTNSGASFPSNHEHRVDFWQNASNGRSLPPHLLQVTGGPARRRSDCLSGVAGKNIGSCRFTYRDRHWSFAGCTPQHSRSLMGPSREPPAIMETSTRSVSKLNAHSSSQPIYTSAIKSTGLPSHLTMYRRNPEVSTLFPLFQSLNPFDISGNQPASTVTAGQRCWAFTRPPGLSIFFIFCATNSNM
ncbi:unnamed protein product [Dicrocoelium dendriticum]|nr:unnamed protein product [Dicrocoelium dendriticum]